MSRPDRHPMPESAGHLRYAIMKDIAMNLDPRAQNPPGTPDPNDPIIPEPSHPSPLPSEPDPYPVTDPIPKPEPPVPEPEPIPTPPEPIPEFPPDVDF